MEWSSFATSYRDMLEQTHPDLNVRDLAAAAERFTGSGNRTVVSFHDVVQALHSIERTFVQPYEIPKRLRRIEGGMR